MKVYVVPLIKGKLGFHCDAKFVPTGLISKGVSYANKKWSDLSQAKPTSYKFKLYGWGKNLMDKMDHKEWFLKSIPLIQEKVGGEKLVILHPSFLTANKASGELSALANSRRGYHQRLFYLSVLGLPITSLFSLLPFPNVPFFYNAFRAYSHYRAHHGAEHLQLMFKEDKILVSTNPTLESHLCSTSKSPQLDDFSLDPTTLKWLAKDLNVPEMEEQLGRALKQETEKSKKDERSDILPLKKNL